MDIQTNIYMYVHYDSRLQKKIHLSVVNSCHRTREFTEKLKK